MTTCGVHCGHTRYDFSSGQRHESHNFRFDSSCREDIAPAKELDYCGYWKVKAKYNKTIRKRYIFFILIPMSSYFQVTPSVNQYYRQINHMKSLSVLHICPTLIIASFYSVIHNFNNAISTHKPNFI